jgi:nicotinamidase-related amidase
MTTSAPETEANELIRATGVLDREPIKTSESALIVVDMVQWQVPRSPIEGTLATPYFVERLRELTIPKQQEAIRAARRLSVPVVFLRVGCYAADYSDASPAMREIFMQAGARADSNACDVIPELEAAPGDLSLIKTGSSGFLTSGLDSHLRNMGIHHVLYCGVVTNACVMLTAAGGFDLGYAGYVLSDSTATLSASLQGESENLIAGYMAEVITTDDAITRLEQGNK